MVLAVFLEASPEASPEAMVIPVLVMEATMTITDPQLALVAALVEALTPLLEQEAGFGVD